MDATTLTIPEQLDVDAVDALTGQLRDLRGSRSGVVVLKGLPGTFCTGMALPVGTSREMGAWLRSHWLRLVDELRGLAVPTLAVVDGPALGAGLALALLADVRVAGTSASFGAFQDDGITTAPGLGWLLAHHLPPGLATSLVLTGRRVDAVAAVAWGLVHEQVSGNPGAVHTLVTRLAGGDRVAPGALRMLRHYEAVSLTDAVLFDSYVVEQRIDEVAS